MASRGGAPGRGPDNLGLALGALAAAIVSPLVSSALLAASGGRVWISLGGLFCAAIAVLRAFRARFAPEGTGLDVRHHFREGARALAIVSLLFSGGMLLLNGALLILARV